MRNQKPMTMDELLKDLQDNKTVQDDPDHVSLEELFNTSFMKKHSNINSFDDFLEKGNFQVNSLEDIGNIHDELFDRHIARETDFSDWKSMLNTANKEYDAKR